MPRFIAMMLCLHALCASAAEAPPQPNPAAQGFPALANFLTLEDPWRLPPRELVGKMLAGPMNLAQGSEEYPLLFDGVRSSDFPGFPVWNQLAYEAEYYCYDPARPVIRFHIGRPLDAGLQLSDYSLSEETKKLFPPLPDSARGEITQNVERLAASLQAQGARRQPFTHPRIRSYLLPKGTKLTLSDFSGTGRGSVYLQIELEPATPLLDRSRLPAFPGAEGFGASTPGGRGGKVYVVTTLADYLPERRDGRKAGTVGEDGRDGKPRVLPGYPEIAAEQPIPGSLRAAIDGTGPRIILFAVSGTIELKAQLKIRNPYITISGGTAPGSGVQIRNWGIEIMTHDVVLRYLRVRVGDVKGPGTLARVLGDQTHALDLSGLNIVVDHCEFAYANDQLVNIYAQRTPASRAAVSFQWNYVYGGLTNSVHEGGNHSHAYAFAGWGGASLHHNLDAYCLGRNPRLSGLRLDYRNNVIHYFWDSGYGDSTMDFLKLNYIGSVLEHGERREAFFEGSQHLCGQFYAADNIVRNCKLKKSPRLMDVPAESIMDAPFAAPAVQTQPALEAYEEVLRSGGANLPARDAITKYVADSVRRDTGGPAGVPEDWPYRGYAVYSPSAPAPALDTDGDGMPDAWEIKFKLNSRDPSDANQDKDGDGYTNIEEFMNGTNPISR